jgi:hypothetical protein
MEYGIQQAIRHKMLTAKPDRKMPQWNGSVQTELKQMTDVTGCRLDSSEMRLSKMVMTKCHWFPK